MIDLRHLPIEPETSWKRMAPLDEIHYKVANAEARVDEIMKEGSEDMNELEKKWDEAEATGKPVKVGRLVVCDICDADVTDSTDQGGFIFQSKAVCPTCAPRMMKSIERYGEQRFIRATCPGGTSFADFVRSYRGPDATVSVTPIQPKREVPKVVQDRFDEEEQARQEQEDEQREDEWEAGMEREREALEMEAEHEAAAREMDDEELEEFERNQRRNP